jgi:predicted MFS family arabinose efflux permease
MAGIPVGALAGGWLADHWGLRATVLATAAAYLAAGLVPALSRRWRDVNRAPSTRGTVTEPELATAA